MQLPYRLLPHEEQPEEYRHTKYNEAVSKNEKTSIFESGNEISFARQKQVIVNHRSKLFQIGY